MSNNFRNELPAYGFRTLDLAFADFIAARAGDDGEEIYLAAALASKALKDRHVCIDLNYFAGQPVDPDVGKLRYPPLNDWLKAIQNSSAVGDPGQFKPLILDKSNRLYLNRYDDYEKSLAQALRGKAESAPVAADLGWLKDAISEPSSSTNEIDWQGLAVFIALTKRLCIITGGPGTGKTYTIARIISLFLQRDAAIKIALAAPTGKAAARLKESIENAGKNLNLDKSIIDSMPDETFTIHRLLGYSPAAHRLKYNADNKLPYDIVIIDEASMIDLSLFARLTAAIDSHTLLILLGDKDQLSSVEAGAVMAEICDNEFTESFSQDFIESYKNISDTDVRKSISGITDKPLADCTVRLRQSYRFKAGSGIDRLSRAILKGESDDTLSIIESSKYPDLDLIDLRNPENGLTDYLRESVSREYAPYLKADSPGKALRRFRDFRVLCAVREGGYGVRTINSQIEKNLAGNGLIKPEIEWYHGQPILITRNDYENSLYNGDTGIVYNSCVETEFHTVCFPGERDKIKRVSTARITAGETCFAMTVHKSQGSEYRRVLLILPPNLSRVLSRELLYTAVTRAKESIAIACIPEILKAAVETKTVRFGGLKDRLKQ